MPGSNEQIGSAPASIAVAEPTPQESQDCHEQCNLLKTFRHSIERGTVLQVSVWSKEAAPENGNSFVVYWVTTKLSYWDEKRAQWVELQSLRERAIPLAAQALLGAYDFIQDCRERQPRPF